MAVRDRGAVAIAIVGGGFMGEAILKGLVRAGVARLDDLLVIEVSEERRRHLEEAHAGLRLAAGVADGIDGCDAIVIAVKPQDLDRLTNALSAALKPEQVVISIMAGVRVGTLVDRLRHERVVRVMPNTPAALGSGFSAWMATESVSSEQRQLTRRILAALGAEAEMHEERYLDAATAISGSGPAYVFLFLEAFIDAGVSIGMPRAVAAEMVLQTVQGSVEMARASGEHPAVLRNAVTSPGGTTAAALQVLERSGLRGVLTDAVVAAFERSRSLGG